MQFSDDISIIFNQLETKLYPRAGSRARPQRRRERGKGKQKEMKSWEGEKS